MRTKEGFRRGPFRPMTSPGPPVTFEGSPQFESTSSASTDSPDSPFAFGPSGGTPAHTAADSAFQIGRSVNLGQPTGGGKPKEMTTAIGHNVVWYAGNTSVGYSLDGGKTWPALINPSTILPDPPGLPLCCDQQVIYAPAANLFVWILQYWCPTGRDSRSEPRGSAGVQGAQ